MVVSGTMRGMTQPMATIIAACIAVAAALITLLGVYLNIRHQTRLDELKAGREVELDALKAAREDAEIRRQERMTLFAEVLSLASQANRMVWAGMSRKSWDSVIQRSGEPSSRDEFSGVVDVLSMSSFRLELLGYPEQASALDHYNAKLVDAWLAADIGARETEPLAQADAIQAVASSRMALVESLKAAGAANSPG